MEQPETFSVSQVAHIINRSPVTVRSWTNTFSEDLSEYARPEADSERRYTADDIAIFQTVAVLRDQREPMKRIKPRVAAGERLEPDPDAEPPESPQEPPKGESGTEIMSPREIDQLRRMAQLQGEFDTVKLERDYLRGQLQTMTERAAGAEAERDMLQAMVQANDAAELAGDESPRPWWQFWK